MRKIKKIGIVGGSYNPIHYGHLIIAERFREQLDLDLVLFVPANISPFKTNIVADRVDSFHRLNMVKLACRSNKYFIVDDFEVKYSRVSYTIKTIKYLKSKYINSELYLLIGEDQGIQFTKWHNWEEILALSKICIASRDIQGKLKSEITELFAQAGNYSPIWINSPLIEISSTEIRDRIKNGQSAKYLLPNGVLNYIEKNELYKAKPWIFTEGEALKCQ